MSYRADKQVLTAHTDGRTDRRTHRQTDAGNDNTRRPKLASGKNHSNDIIAPTVLHWLQIRIMASQITVCAISSAGLQQRKHQTPHITVPSQRESSNAPQIMACHLFVTKPLSKPMLDYSPIGPLGTNLSEILIKMQNFSFTKLLLKISSAKMLTIFVQGERS